MNDLKIIGKLLKEKREYNKTLVMGYGEFIYIPCYLASLMGEGVKYQSPTRSPIYPYYDKNYPIKSVISIENPYDKDIKNYIYNIIPNQYDEIFMIFERKISYEFKGKIIDAFQDMGVKSVNFIYFE